MTLVLVLALLAAPFTVVAQDDAEVEPAAAAGAAESAPAPETAGPEAAAPAAPPAEVQLTAPPPELKKLERWLGRWKMTYTLTSEFTDGKGGSGEGVMTCTRVLGGFAFMTQTDSTGTLGEQHDITVWAWDPNAKEFKSHQLNHSSCYRVKTVSMKLAGDVMVIKGAIPAGKGELGITEVNKFVGKDRVETKAELAIGKRVVPMATGGYTRLQ
jgi:hypothetical protein